MVKVLAGGAGSGKTKVMIDNANSVINEVRGTFVYVENTDKHMQLLDSKIRFVSTEGLKINDYPSLYGFICGLLSANYDIQKIYLDGLFKIVGDNEKDLPEFLEDIEKVVNDSETDLVLAVTLTDKDVESKIKKYIISEELV